MDLRLVISARELRKRYRGAEVDALNGINLKVFEGEFFGLLGPNSAGKTTLGSLICGLLNPTSGEILVFDRKVNHKNSDVSSRIGLVPQEIALYDTLTVKENISFFGKLHGIEGQFLKEKVNNFIEIFNLGEHAAKRVSKCSSPSSDQCTTNI